MSDGLTCLKCEEVKRPRTGFLSLISAPARRTLEREGITSLQNLAIYSEPELLKLHGVGPSTIPKLRQALKKKGPSFREKIINIDNQNRKRWTSP